MTLPTPYQKESDAYVAKQKELEVEEEALKQAKIDNEHNYHSCDCEYCEEDTEKRVEYCKRNVKRAESELKALGETLQKAIRKARA